jgi:hypothetical protein
MIDSENGIIMVPEIDPKLGKNDLELFVEPDLDLTAPRSLF